MMKAFSFLTILESLSKKLSILRTKMHSDNLRVDYESITSQLRVSRPFSRTSFCASFNLSRRASHFAAILTILFTIGVGTVSAQAITITEPTNATTTNNGITISGTLATNKTIDGEGNQKVFKVSSNNGTSNTISISSTTSNIKSIVLYGSAQTSGSAATLGVDIQISSDNKTYNVCTNGIDVSGGATGTDPKSGKGIYISAYASHSEVTITFSSEQRYVRITKAATGDNIKETAFKTVKVYTSSECTEPTITFSNGAYTVGGSALNLSTLFTSNSNGAVTYTVTDANGTGASINGTSFTATSTGTATVKATQAANGDYCSGEVTATITVSAASGGGDDGDNCITITNFDTSQKSASDNKPDSESKYLFGYTDANKTSSYTITTSKTNNKGENSGNDLYLYYGTHVNIYANNITDKTPKDFTNVTSISLDVKMVKSGNTSSFSIKVGDNVVASAVSVTTNTYTTFTYNNLNNLDGKITIIAGGSSTNHHIYVDNIKICYTPDPNTVSFDANGGEEVDPITQTAVGAAILLPTATRDGCTFKGWYTDASGGTKIGEAGESYIPTDDITLYAQWILPSTGNATITYTLTESAATVSGEVTGVSTITDLSTQFATSSLSIGSGDSKKSYCGKITGHSADDNQRYVSLKFKVTDGYEFEVSNVNVTIFANSTSNMKAKVVLSDGTTNIESEELTCASSNDSKFTFPADAFDNKSLKGTVTVYIYQWGVASKRTYIKSPVTITGTIKPTCTAPTLSYETTAVTKTFGDAAFTNTLTNTNGVAVAYSSTNENVATVANNGQVTIVGAGQTTITASSAEQTVSGTLYCEAEASYTLTVNKANISPTLTYNPNSFAIGGTANPNLTGNTGNGTVTYSSSNTSVATVNQNGVVTAVAEGTATITATIDASANYNGGTATCQISVHCTAPTSVTVTSTNEFGWRYSIGETISLIATATGGSGNYTYQWQKFIGDTWTNIDGATAATYTKTNCTTGDGGSYRCVVSTGNDCSRESEGYFVRVFTLNGGYTTDGEWTAHKIDWTDENTGVVTISLPVSKTYYFKVTDNDGKWFGYGDASNYIIQPWQADCGTGNNNIRLFTGPAGDYKFTINIEHAQENSPYVNIKVDYPEVTHPVEGYAYINKWWEKCYIHWWDNSDQALTTWGSDPKINDDRYVNICGTDYWYFPVIETYTNFIAKDNAGDPANTTGDQSTTNHSGQNITHNGSAWVWQEFSTYSITFNGNGNTGGSMTNVTGITCGGSATLTQNAFTRTGYTFAGWATTALGAVAHADKATISNITSDITLYAKWNAITYNITYEGLEGATHSNPPTYTIESETITFTNPSERTGYTFAGWDPTSIEQGSTGNKTVTATWTANDYTITYEGNHPTNAWNNNFAVKNIPTEQTLAGGTGTVSNNTPTITEKESSEYAIYDFAGWNTAADGTGTSYAKGAAITITENTTLYAQWQAKTYNITYYDTDQTTALTGLTPISYTYGTGVASLPTPTKTGYTFASWTQWWNGGSKTNVTTIAEDAWGDVQLAAQWTANAPVEPDPDLECETTTITYTLVTPNNNTATQNVSGTDKITTLTGATAKGTATANTGEINNSFSDYSVRYGASSGSDNTDNGVTFTFDVPTGYVFKPSDINTNLMCYGWGQDENNGTQLYKFYGTLSDGATTINGTADPGKKNGANADIEYSDITGKTLSGTVTLRLNAVKVGGEYQSFRIKSPITIVGELCSTQTYTITYDNNGGSGTMESTTNVVAANTFTREGYTFAGWNTAEDGTGTSYAAGDYVSSNLMLYAQWECIEPEFTVSYNKTEYTINDDDASAITVTVTAGNSSEVNYQWYSNTTNDRSSGSAITGATNASYTPSTTIVGTTYYWCEISNSCSTIKTAAIAITVSAAKSTPTVNWTDPTGEIHYGGSGYSITAEVNDEWNGTLLPSMLTAPAGINIKGVTIADKSITATFDVTATFDRSQEKILFCLTLPETNDYTRLVDEHPVDYVNCATGASESYVINVLEKDNANKYGDYYYWLNTAGWIVPNPYSSCNSETKSTTFGDGQKFEYKHNTNSQTVYVRTFHGGVNKVRIYAEFRNPDMTVTGAYKHTDYFKTQNDTYKLKVSDYTIVYNGDANATSMGESGYKYVDVIFKTPLAVNDIIALTFDKSRVRVQGAVLETESGSSLETSLQWSNSIANEATEEKALSDANFTYTAQQTGENSNSAGAITYSSSNPTVATVNAQTGEVSIEAAGTTTITATLAPSGCYAKATITYTLTVSEQTCTIASGTLTASKTEKNTCEEVTLTIDGYESGATIQWWYNGAAIETTPAGITINNNTLTTMLAGTYSVLVTKDCRVRTNSVTITNTTSTATATPLVSEWYVKAGRLTPPIALLKLEGGAVLDGTSWEKGGESSEAPYESNPIYEENGIVYLTGTPPNTNETEADISYTLNFSITNGCDDSPMMVDPITIVHQKNTDKHVLAFVVGNTEKKDEKYVAIGKGFTESIPASQTTNVSLYNEIAKNFDVQPTNIYSTDDEQKIKEYYSRFDIICITDYPNTKETGVNGKSYTDAMGALIDIRPILSMEAWVSKYPNWNDKGVTGDPKSPTTRQYSMLLQCKDHEIFANTSLVSEIVDGEAMYRVTMVDKNQEQYKTLDDTYGDQTPHAEKATTKDKDGKETITGYGYGSNPALQGFTYTSAMSSMLPIGIIDDGAGNNLQVGLERQYEIEARMIVLGVNSYAMERLTADGETVIINALKYLMKKNAKDISDCSTYFVGGDETDPTAWSNENNWGPTKTLPNSSQEARILAPCVVSDYTAKVASVKIVTDGTYAPGYGENGEGFPATGSLTIAPNGALVVKGRIQAATAPNYLETRNTDVTDLIVQSDATGNGALIFNNAAGDTKATVAMYSKAYTNIVDGKKKKHWQYCAIPIHEAPIPEFFWGAYTYLWEEPNGAWTRKRDGATLYEWQPIGVSYGAVMDEQPTYRFYGELTSTDEQSFDLTYTEGTYGGMNLIGNSWTAPINIAAFEDADFEGDVTKEILIHNTGRREEVGPDYNYGTVENTSEKPGQWIAIPIGAPKVPEYDGVKVISSLQAFQINVTAASTLTLNYDRLVRSTKQEDLTTPMRAPSRKAQVATIVPKEVRMLKVRVADKKNHADIYIFDHDGFTLQYDNGWDARFGGIVDNYPSLSVLTQDGEMSMAAIPTIDGTTLGFSSGTDNEYMISFKYTGEETLYLNDMQLKKSTQISNINQYYFTTDVNDMYNRFVISKESFDSPNISTGLANIVTDGNGLQVTNPNQENLQVILIDAAGRLCSIYNTAEPMFNIELPATQGVYMINVKGETTNIVRKVVK